MKSKLLRILLITAFSLVTQQSCLDLSEVNKYFISFKILGVFESPSDASGSFDPKYESFTLKKITLTTDDDQTVDFTPEIIESTKVNHQSQIFYRSEIPSTAVGKSFKMCTIEFETEVLANSAYAKDQVIQLSNPFVYYESTFSLAEAKNATFVLKVKWKNTVTRTSEEPFEESISEPSFELSFTDS